MGAGEKLKYLRKTWITSDCWFNAGCWSNLICTSAELEALQHFPLLHNCAENPSNIAIQLANFLHAVKFPPLKTWSLIIRAFGHNKNFGVWLKPKILKLEKKFMVCSPRKDLNSLLVLQNMFIKNFQIFVNVRGSEWSYDTLGEGQASKSLLKWGGGGVDPLRYFPVSIFAHSNCGIWGGCWWTLGQPKASPVNVYGRGGGIIGQHASIRASHHDIAYRHVAYQRDTLSSNYYHYLLPNLRWI